MTKAEHGTMRRASAFSATSGWMPLLMSGAATALLLGYLATGPHEPHMVVEHGVARADESATARLWQLLIVLQLPLMGGFALRWLPRQPRQACALLALHVLAIVAAVLPVVLLEG